ncbi:MAG TPA: hypothetical protein VMA72_27485 [Streptosporangiaceae bacterium]|nr:hypothetical protein [Streptosporangiaceae bacterium]
MTAETATAVAPQTERESLWRTSTPPSWPWRRRAILLAGAAQLITIAALLSVDPLPATWWALLLAIAPAPLAAVAGFGAGRVARAAAWAGVAVILAGLIGGILHTGLFFAPALIVLVVGAVKLGRETA